MSLYSQYIKEREDFETIELTWGFITYKIQGDECYARDIFILPEYRSFDAAKFLIESVREIAKSRGCKYLLGTIAPEAKGSGRSYKLMQYYGFTPVKQVNDLIVLRKAI